MRSIAQEFGAEFEINDSFLSVSLEECIKRDLKRPNSIGEQIIKKMYNQYLKPHIPKIEYNEMLQDCYICDLDGTLAIMNGRSQFDWDKVDTDLVNTSLASLLRLIMRSKTEVLFVSGRDTICREKTIDWIMNCELGFDSKEVVNDKLFMRDNGDCRDDTIIKEEIYRKSIEGKYIIS
jgi:hypothetical protein